MFAPSSVSILSGSSETKKGASSPPRPSIASTMDKGMVSCVVLQSLPRATRSTQPPNERGTLGLTSFTTHAAACDPTPTGKSSWPWARRRSRRRAPSSRSAGSTRSTSRACQRTASRYVRRRPPFPLSRPPSLSSPAPLQRAIRAPSAPKAWRLRRARDNPLSLSVRSSFPRLFVRSFVRSFLPSLRARRRRPRDCQSRAKNAVTMQLRNELRGSRRPKLFDRAEDVYFDFEVQYLLSRHKHD